MNDIIAAVRDIAEGRQPSTDISETLYKHGCLYLLSKLEKSGVKEKVSLERTANYISTKTRYKICESVFVKLKNIDVQYAVIKGAVLSKMAYSDPLYRKSADIDLLVSRNDIDHVKNILFEEGFVQGRVAEDKIIPFTREELIFQAGISHQIAPFIKKTGNTICPFVNVDVNLDIMWGESKIQTDMGYLLSETEDSELYGVKFRKLKPEAEFVSLCTHHYKDMNSIYMLWTGHLRLSLFSDIYYYLKNAVIDIPKLKGIAQKINVGKYLYYCLHYTDKVFDSSFIQTYLKEFESLEDENIINTYGLDEREIKTWDLDFYNRLLTPNLIAYLDYHFDNLDKNKIRLNSKYM